MEIELSPKAFKEFKSLSKAIQERFIAAFERLENDPFNIKRELRAKKLTDGRYSLRIGNYRSIYKVENDLIMVTVIRHRKDAYR